MSNKNKYNRTVSPDEIESAVTEQEATTESSTTEETTAMSEPVTTKTPKETATAVPASVPSTAKIEPKKLPVKEDRNAIKLTEFEKMLNEYVAAVSVVRPSEDVRNKFVKEFMKLISFMFIANSYPVYNRFLTFVINERNGAMRNTVALCGIHKLKDQRKKEETSAFYTVVYALARSIVYQSPFRLSVKAIRMSINNETFINWLINKINR